MSNIEMNQYGDNAVQIAEMSGGEIHIHQTHLNKNSGLLVVKNSKDLVVTNYNATIEHFLTNPPRKNGNEFSFSITVVTSQYL